MIADPDGLGLEALLTRAESMLARRKESYYGGRSRMVINEDDYRNGMRDLRAALALVLKAKGKTDDVEHVRRIVL